MSQLANARRQVTSIRSLIRQKKYMPAIQALHDTVLTVLKTPLMKSERDEFERMIDDATYHIMNEETIRRSAALQIKYTPGQEKELLESLRMLLEAFQENFQQQAEDALRLNAEFRQKQLDKGQALLDAGNFDEARKVFDSLANDNKQDSELYADIGERFLKAVQYADAARYLGDAIAMSPDSAHLYNSLAMAHRKLGEYAQAEQCYLKAAKGGYKDSHLFFNMGRLYIDWQMWEKAIKAGKGALTLDPDFAEARKLMNYAERKLREQSTETPEV